MKKENILNLFPIETERLRIRVATLNDNYLIQNAKESNAHILRRWMSWSNDEGMALLGTVNYLNLTNGTNNKRNIAVIAVDKLTGEHVLSTGLDAEDDAFDRFSTGWWLSVGREGKGLACEAMQALIQLWRDQNIGQKITADYYKGNDRSRKLLERLGFQHIGTEPNAHQCHLNGELMDILNYELEMRK